MDRYKRLRIVGKGSFGFGVLTQDTKNLKYYLMKAIDVSMMSKEQRIQAFEEVNAMREMRHPFIVKYRESFLHNKRYLCIVMNYCKNGDLSTYIQNHRRNKEHIQEEQVLKLLVQMLLGISHIHEQKILHRDLKSENIFLDSKFDAQIGDFGVAKKLKGDDISTDTVIGTPFYLAPEVCQKLPYNEKADIWSLGCIAYEMCALKHPFDAASINGLIIKITRGEFQEIPSYYSPELNKLIIGMLQVDPSKRLSTDEIFKKKFLKKTLNNVIETASQRYSSWKGPSCELMNSTDSKKIEIVDLQDHSQTSLQNSKSSSPYKHSVQVERLTLGESDLEKDCNLDTIAELIEKKRFELEELLGFEQMSQIYQTVKVDGDMREVAKEIVDEVKELINLEHFYFNN